MMEAQVQEHVRQGLWTVRDVAERLSVPVSWVYSHVASGDLPHVKVGRYVRFNPRAVSEWLAGSCGAKTAAAER
jgi:excisionase family DNA binding protein